MSSWKWPVVVLALVVVLGTGGYAVAQTRGSEASYRTATATVGDVERTLDLSGTVTAAGRRDLTFGAAGSVAGVAVKAGQRVKSGQVLARLDPTSFDAAVTAAVATLAKARAQLASDEDAQSTAVTTSASTSASSTPKTSTSSTQASKASPATKTPATKTPATKTPATKTPATGADPALQKLLAQLGGQQKAVTQAQTAASTAITAAKAALATQSDACTTGSTPPASRSASPPASPSASPSGSPSASPSADSDADAGDDDSGNSGDSSVSAECSTALAAVQSAQDTVAQKQDTLQVALTALGQTLGQAVKATGTGSQGSSNQESGQSSNQGSGQSSQSSAGSPASQSSGQASTPAAASDSGQGSGTVARSGSGDSVTAARLAQDQADIDTAQARLVQARAERQAATLRAPYAGRILQSDLTKGDLVGVSDPAFVLVGSGATTVTTTVTTAQVPAVRRGQRVSVVPAGWTTSLTGTVSAIGLLPDSNSAFPVTVTVSSTRTVAEGSTASVAIVTGSAKKAVTVPVTALTTNGARTTVQVLSADTVTRTSVTTGVLGTRRASITQGLETGAKVVLADLDAAVPSSTTGNQRTRLNGPGGAGGLGTQTSRR